MENIKKFLNNLIFGRNTEVGIRNKERNHKRIIAGPLKLDRPLFGDVKIFDLEIGELKRKKNNFFNAETFQKINKIITSDLDFLSVSQIVVDAIRKELGYVAGTLFIIEKEKGIEYPYIISTDLIKKLEVIFGKPTSGHVGQLVVQDNFAVKCVSTKKAYVGNDLRDFVSPVLSYNKARFIQKIFKMNTTVIIPLIVKDQVIGSLMVNSARKSISEEERILLSLFSDQIAIALNNAILYRNINDKIRSLQEKTQDLESLLALGSMSLLGTEVENSVQNIMDILPVKLGHLGVLGAVLTRYDEKDGKVYAYITTESALVQKAKKLLPKSSLGDYYVLVNKTEPLKYSLTTKSILNNEIIKSDNLVDFISPPVDARTAWLMQKMMGGKSFVAVPINIRGEKMGAVMFMFKKQLSQIAGRDIDILKAFTQHVGVVLENLQFYENLNENIKELTKTKNNLEEAISMKNDFLHIVSHQLRTPLTAVRGFVYMWRDGDFDNLASGKLKEIRARVADNIDRLNNIVNDMIIAMESQGSMKLIFAPTNIETLLKENIEILKSGFEKKGLYIKYQKINKSIPLIEADGKYLRHVFMNLIDNAVKYTERGGLEITIRREKNTIYVRFVDTGVGINDSDKDLLFKKFSRGKNSAHINPGGSGLGLFISKQILDEHHGTLQMSSMGEGKGATFVVELPVKQPFVASSFA